MKFIFSLSLSFLVFTSYCQTRSETVDWLTYYLNKYFHEGGDNFNIKDMQYSLRNNKTYYYSTRNFSFSKNKLVIKTQTFTVKDTIAISFGEYLRERVDSILLKNVLRIELIKGIDSKYKSNQYVYKIELIFREPVKREDFFQRYLPLSIESTNSELTEDLAKKVKSAFETLIIIYGGRPVREIF